MRRYRSTQPAAAWLWFKYDSRDRTLRIQWKQGSVEVKRDVSPSTYQRLIESRSKLAFIRREIGTVHPPCPERFRTNQTPGSALQST